MRTFFLAILFALFVPSDSVGQSVQTFVHDFGEYKIYQRVGSAGSVTWITTVKIKGRECKQMFVSPVKITDNRIVFQGGTTWKLRKAEGGMKIEFPDERVVKYKFTDENPLRYCGGKREI